METIRADYLFQRLDQFLNLSRESASQEKTEGVSNTIAFIHVLVDMGIVTEARA